MAETTNNLTDERLDQILALGTMCNTVNLCLPSREIHAALSELIARRAAEADAKPVAWDARDDAAYATVLGFLVANPCHTHIGWQINRSSMNRISDVMRAYRAVRDDEHTRSLYTPEVKSTASPAAPRPAAAYEGSDAELVNAESVTEEAAAESDPSPADREGLREVIGVPFTFDLARCNHMGKPAIDCPHCLRHALAAAERERDQAIAEANRRDRKWMDGINEIVGEKLSYDFPDGSASRGLDMFVRELRRKRDAAWAFKAYVHKRLDEAGVPNHPNPETHDGCRIGARLDWLLSERDDARAKLAAAEREAGRLREALQFYADEKNWRDEIGGEGASKAVPVTQQQEEGGGIDVADCGDIARAALARPADPGATDTTHGDQHG